MKTINNKKGFRYEKLNVLLSFNINPQQSETMFIIIHSRDQCLLHKLNEFATDQSVYHRLFMELIVWEV